MRYYNLVITDPASGKVVKQYSSLNANNSTNLGALNIEIDVPSYAADLPMGQAMIKVWGISLQDISQALNLGPYYDSSGNYQVGKNIKLYAGMAKGLPLASPKQAGLILQGQIQSCFGNWQDTTQTLDFVVTAAPGSESKPVNITHEWPAGQTLGDMVKNALTIAYPGYTINVATSPNLVRANNQPGFYENIEQFARYLRDASRHILQGQPGYQGVSVVVQNGQITVSDETQSKSQTKAIAFTDLIGQPTWIDIATIQFKTVMRADLKPLDYVTMPQTQVTTSAQSYAQFRDSSAFKGTFQIKNMRHVGNFRQPDGNSWVTIFEAYTSQQ